MLTSSDNDTASKSRKGTLRNTDSLFKDDNTETRKINLTPSLLRDDSSSSTVRSIESKEVCIRILSRTWRVGALIFVQLRNRPSIDSLEKGSSSPEKSKDDRKRKEKKSKLGGFFKRKDKKGKSLQDSSEDADRISEEGVRLQSPQPGTSSETFKDEGQTPRSVPQPQPQRQTSKLQKSPPSKLSPKSSVNRGEAPSIRSVMEPPTSNVLQPSSRSPPKLNMEFESAPLVDPEPEQTVEPTMVPGPVVNTTLTREEPTEIESPKSTRHGMFSPIKDVLRSSPSSSEPKPEKAKKAKHRMPIDDFDSSSDSEERSERPEPTNIPPDRSAPPQQVDEPSKDRLSESPVEVSLQEQRQPQHPPGLMIDTSSQDDPSTSPVSPLSSPELVEAPNEGTTRDETPASTAQSSANAPSWNDAHLRAYLDDGSDIRDLLVVVNHKTKVKPAASDHPLVKDLFKEENRKIGEMSTRLDGLLGDWLARKSNTTPR